MTLKIPLHEGAGFRVRAKWLIHNSNCGWNLKIEASCSKIHIIANQRINRYVCNRSIKERAARRIPERRV
jgi:hypothetical protein